MRVVVLPAAVKGMGHGVNLAVGAPGMPHPSVGELCHLESSRRGMRGPYDADGCTVPFCHARPPPFPLAFAVSELVIWSLPA
jgi:hypothetical protein